jgi:transposase-like protein
MLLEVFMWKIPKRNYTAEFKVEAVKLVEGGQQPAAVAKQLGISELSLPVNFEYQR